MEQVLPVINTVFVVIASLLSLCGVVSFYIRDKVEAKGRVIKLPRDREEIDPGIYRIILITILVIGVVIRVWQFGAVPGGMNQDGAMAGVEGKALADYGTDRYGTPYPAHLYAWGYGQMSSLLSYMIMIFVKLFGLNAVTARLPLLLMSIAGGICFYLFVKDNFGKKAALIAAMVVAVNPWHLMQSRWAVDCNLLPHCFIIGLFLFSRGLLKKRLYLYLSMVFFGLCMYCYGITIYTIPVFLIAISLYYAIRKRIRVRDVLISAGVYLLVAWPFILTMMINFFQWETIELPFVTLQYFPESTRTNDILFFSGNIGQQLLTNIGYFMNATFLQVKDAPQNDMPFFGTIYYFSTPFVLAGIISLPKLKVVGNKSLAVFALLIGVWVGLMTNRVNVNRMNIIYYGMMLFAAIGIYVVIRELRFTKWIIPLMYIVIAVFMVQYYFTAYNEEFSDKFYAGFGDALTEAEDTGAQRIYITADIQNKGLWRVSEIMTLFYDETDALYFQGKTNTNHSVGCLPYTERFVYESICDETVTKSQGQSAAYVIMESDKQYFDSNQYNFTDHGKFCTVTKKQHLH